MLVLKDACQKYTCRCTVRTVEQAATTDREEHGGRKRVGARCGWVRQSAQLLMPLYGCLKEFVLGSEVVAPMTRR
jgi:hypothetical protein